jgi:hypothetical protein
MGGQRAVAERTSVCVAHADAATCGGKGVKGSGEAGTSCRADDATGRVNAMA